MPLLSRGRFAPSLDLLVALATRSIAAWIPIAPKWYKASSLSSNSELGKHIRIWGLLGGNLQHAIESQRHNILLTTITGSRLDEMGQTLGFARQGEEDDDTYAQRVASELVADRVTPNALLKIVPLLTESQVSSELYEPWTNLLFWGDATPRSGSGRLIDTRYWRGGVLDLITNVYVPGLSEFVNRYRAAGVSRKLTLSMEGQVTVNNDALAVVFADDTQDFVTNSIDVWIESDALRFDVFRDETGITSLGPLGIEDARTVEVYTENLVYLGNASGIRFENLSRNYALMADMLASANEGMPVYTVTTGPFDLTAPTDVQPGTLILDDTEIMDSGAFGG